MNAASIISLARKMTGNTSENSVSTTDAVTMLNKAYKDFYKKIVALDRNYFWDRWTASTVANQYEYTFKDANSPTFGIYKPENIKIKYTDTSEFKNVEFRDWDSLEETAEYYAEKQPVDEPFAIITDDKYFHIFPTPKISVTNGLVLEGAKKPYDLTISSVENDILIDNLYHEVISYLMCPMIEKSKMNLEGKNDAIAEANIVVADALKSMGLLNTKAVRAKIKDLSHLE